MAMRTSEKDKDKEGQRAKEIIVDVIKDMTPYLLILSIIIALIMLTGSISVPAKNGGTIEVANPNFVNPAIVYIKASNGTTLYNPQADLYDSNTVCADAYTRLKTLCNSFCSPSMKNDYLNRKNYHDYSKSHMPIDNVQNNFPNWDGWNMTYTQAQAYDMKWSMFYARQNSACAVCSGIEDVKPTYVR